MGGERTGLQSGSLLRVGGIEAVEPARGVEGVGSFSGVGIKQVKAGTRGSDDWLVLNKGC